MEKLSNVEKKLLRLPQTHLNLRHFPVTWYDVLSHLILSITKILSQRVAMLAVCKQSFRHSDQQSLLFFRWEKLTKHLFIGDKKV
ncbi:CLUMA_CG007988, isoform A [Clunio marinus]|uniref:CLUMA_CG007988, isoform A n=1 Tax=Clunio marinus TaxID=568069 RepID=A0A1J1I407_9DIPT|nr:CLUMA_CG007988, isoform A [Clunio marinus]